ncbi:sugar nucleotide-binding protein [Luminiphilus sp.]|nr:sugar nucleotide-binding protein [Luminiphilus sp.]
MKRIVILGASGYVGCSCARHYSSMTDVFTITAGKAGCELSVDLVSDNFVSFISSVWPGDTVLFLAAISSPDRCAELGGAAQLINVNNTISLIEQLTAKGANVVFCSSDAVMGKYAVKSYENSPVRPSGIYGEMKAAVELAVSENPNVKVARFSLVLGSGDKFTEMLKHASASGQEVEIFAGFVRNVVSIDDVTEGLYLLAKYWDQFPQKVFNFSGPELVSRECLVATFADVIPGLRYRVTDAPEKFWTNRERSVETDCHNFSLLLGRPPRSLSQIVSSWVQ